MVFTVIGTGVGDEPLQYQKASLADAGHLATKMSDNGVPDVAIFDGNGAEISVCEAWSAYQQQSRKTPFHSKAPRTNQ